jgi:hypothetical protein
MVDMYGILRVVNRAQGPDLGESHAVSLDIGK